MLTSCRARPRRCWRSLRSVLPGLVQSIADRSTNPYTVRHREHPHHAGTGDPGAAGRAGAMGPACGGAGCDRPARKTSPIGPGSRPPSPDWSILNPVGLAFLQADAEPLGAAIVMWELTATDHARSCSALLLVLAWLECYIRERILRRRAGAGAIIRTSRAAGANCRKRSDVGQPLSLGLGAILLGYFPMFIATLSLVTSIYNGYLNGKFVRFHSAQCRPAPNICERCKDDHRRLFSGQGETGRASTRRAATHPARRDLRPKRPTPVAKFGALGDVSGQSARTKPRRVALHPV